MHNRTYFFDLFVEDIERAKTFYNKVFNFNFVDQQVEESPYLNSKISHIIEANSDNSAESTILGSLVELSTEKQHLSPMIIYIPCENIEEVEGKIEASDGIIISSKKHVINDVYTTIFQDTEGNLVGLVSNH